MSECCKIKRLHLIYASAVQFIGNTKLPFSESDNIDHPISLYAATKKQLIVTYSVYMIYPLQVCVFYSLWPWGRPDMALFKFTKSILNNEFIEVYNNGEMVRDLLILTI